MLKVAEWKLSISMMEWPNFDSINYKVIWESESAACKATSVVKGVKLLDLTENVYVRGGFKCSGKEDDGFGKSADRQLHNLSPVNIPCSDNWKYHSLRIVATCTSRLNRNANDNKSWLQHQASWVGESLVDKFTFRDSLRPRWAGRRFWQIFRYCWQQTKHLFSTSLRAASPCPKYIVLRSQSLQIRVWTFLCLLSYFVKFGRCSQCAGKSTQFAGSTVVKGIYCTGDWGLNIIWGFYRHVLELRILALLFITWRRQIGFLWWAS